MADGLHDARDVVGALHDPAMGRFFDDPQVLRRPVDADRRVRIGIWPGQKVELEGCRYGRRVFAAKNIIAFGQELAQGAVKLAPVVQGRFDKMPGP